MRTIFTIIILSYSIGIYSQEIYQTIQDVKPSKLYIGMSYSSDLNYRRMSVAPGADSLQFIPDLYNGIEIPRLSYTTGLKVLYKVSPKMALESGILYSIKGYQSRLRAFSSWPDMTTEMAKYIYKFHFYEIPVMARYQFGSKKSTFFLTGGMVNHFFSKQTFTSIMKVDNKLERKTSEVDHDIRSYTLSGSLGFGFRLQLGTSLDISINPVARYQLINIYKGPIRENLWNAGLDLSLYKSL